MLEDLREDSADLIEKYKLNHPKINLHFNDSLYHLISKAEFSEVVIWQNQKEHFRSLLKQLQLNELVKSTQAGIDKEVKVDSFCFDNFRLSKRGMINVSGNALIYSSPSRVFSIIQPDKKSYHTARLDSVTIRNCYTQIYKNNPRRIDSVYELMTEYPNAKPSVFYMTEVDADHYLVCVFFYDYTETENKDTVFKGIYSKSYWLTYTLSSRNFSDLTDIEAALGNRYYPMSMAYKNIKGEIILSVLAKNKDEQIGVLKLKMNEGKNTIEQTDIQLQSKPNIHKYTDGGVNLVFCKNLFCYWFADTVYDVNQLKPAFVIPWSKIVSYENKLGEIQNNKKQVCSMYSDKGLHRIIYFFNEKYYFVSFTKDAVLNFYPLSKDYTSYSFLSNTQIAGIDIKSGCVALLNY